MGNEITRELGKESVPENNVKINQDILDSIDKKKRFYENKEGSALVKAKEDILNMISYSEDEDNNNNRSNIGTIKKENLYNIEVEDNRDFSFMQTKKKNNFYDASKSTNQSSHGSSIDYGNNNLSNNRFSKNSKNSNSIDIKKKYSNYIKNQGQYEDNNEININNDNFNKNTNNNNYKRTEFGSIKKFKETNYVL